jgi:hypothetical protein
MSLGIEVQEPLSSWQFHHLRILSDCNLKVRLVPPISGRLASFLHFFHSLVANFLICAKCKRRFCLGGKLEAYGDGDPIFNRLACTLDGCWKEWMSGISS